MIYSPVKCELMNKKDDPNNVKDTPTPPFVLIMVPGLVA